MDEKTRELRDAHDALAPVYFERLAGLLAQMPVEQALLWLFAQFVGQSGSSTVIDLGCGTGRLVPHLAALGLTPSGLDLSPEMVRCARREYPEYRFAEGDLRSIPLADASFDGAVCWYSLIYLTDTDRPRAFAELARVVRPGGYVAIAYKLGDNTMRRSTDVLGTGQTYDVYWMSADEVEEQATANGFETVFAGSRPAGEGELQPQGYYIARRS